MSIYFYVCTSATKADSVGKSDCIYIYLCTENGNHGKLLITSVYMCVCNSARTVGTNVVTTSPLAISSVTEGWHTHTYTCTFYLIDSPTLCSFALSLFIAPRLDSVCISQMVDFFCSRFTFRSIPPHRSYKECIRSTSNRTTCSHIHFSHGAAEKPILFVFLGTYCYYCLQSHPNSLSTHDNST